MHYLDLFSGIGGFHLGLEQAGFEFDYVGYSEIDKYAKQVYAKHFKESEDLGDVNNINVSKLPRIDLITFGSPCQDLSIAGKGRGLDGERSGLFFRAIEIIKHCKPNTFIWENVKGAFSSNGGKDFFTVLRTIADLGIYDIEWQLLNTRWFLPQNRERIYLVGHSRGSGGFKVFPIRGKEQPNTRQCGFDISYTIDANYHKGTNNAVKGRRQVVAAPLKFQERNQKNYQGDYAFTIDSCNTGGIMQDKAIRRLTPMECEKLQGFPIGWTKQCSDSQRYKMLGNAVSVPVVKAVGERLL